MEVQSFDFKSLATTTHTMHMYYLYCILYSHREGFSVHHLGFQMWQTHICSKRQNQNKICFDFNDKSVNYAQNKWKESHGCLNCYSVTNCMTEIMQLTHPFDIPERSITIFTSFTAPCWEKMFRRSLSLTFINTHTHFIPFLTSRQLRENERR